MCLYDLCRLSPQLHSCTSLPMKLRKSREVPMSLEQLAQHVDVKKEMEYLQLFAMVGNL